ncbi:HAD family hydrolase [Teredinibacter haidensis]|mgnify:CR=1 FL=1|uniref:histidinol-phosphatase n=1 Tax=Teredinibacter haidensis TaxID=2731755 RepID=UPI0009FB11D7|nr:HAD family hydrolase [Teredinibacter haidensis]
MSLAIFDLDNTLIAGDSDHAWGEFLIEQNIVDGEAFKQANDQFYQDYLNRTLDINAYLRFALQPLTRFSMTELCELHRIFFDQKITPILLPKAEALVTEHRQKGDRILVITATNRFITEPIAQALGIHELLASEGEVVNDRYTGEPTGTPCYQEGKVQRLNQWLEKEGESLSGSHFYSDSANDLPLLETVETPVAVDPDDKLRQVANERNWAIISLR